MPEPLADLTPASPEDLARSLAHALQFNGKKRYRASGGAMAEITADHLVKHLQMCGYVFLSKPSISGGHSSLMGRARERE
jgi:hypothetical protein